MGGGGGARALEKKGFKKELTLCEGLSISKYQYIKYNPALRLKFRRGPPSGPQHELGGHAPCRRAGSGFPDYVLGVSGVFDALFALKDLVSGDDSRAPLLGRIPCVAKIDDS